MHVSWSANPLSWPAALSGSLPASTCGMGGAPSSISLLAAKHPGPSLQLLVANDPCWPAGVPTRHWFSYPVAGNLVQPEEPHSLMGSH